MEREQRLIDAYDLADKVHKSKCDNPHIDAKVARNHTFEHEHLLKMICSEPTVDSVSRGVHDQVRWERDTAIGQLEEHGIPFGGIAPDVVKVVRCKDCKFSLIGGKACSIFVSSGLPYICTEPDGFCHRGERRTDNG